ncbi:MAG: hypothetical protein ACYC1C_05430 [Chloroflexota bacterium]
MKRVSRTAVQAVENTRETYHRHKLAEVGEVFRKEAEALDNQSSLKTIIIP